MSHKHIIEVVGGPWDGALIDFADQLVPKGPSERYGFPAPSLAQAFWWGIPIYESDDGRRYIEWGDVVRG